ncbi:hypothetical protein NDU88_000967 [Pleurodeles waltl]|uniref:Uncharacterized protein n=1 Tax=Pleurodeles waltl TaxID=8319 RepID=A0AAV7R8V4_PLEWA|nr:hypothetical protein NDU88_000967 [Pleurodeles waltl]
MRFLQSSLAWDRSEEAQRVNWCVLLAQDRINPNFSLRTPGGIAAVSVYRALCARAARRCRRWLVPARSRAWKLGSAQRVIGGRGVCPAAQEPPEEGQL